VWFTIVVQSSACEVFSWTLILQYGITFILYIEYYDNSYYANKKNKKNQLRVTLAFFLPIWYWFKNKKKVPV